MTDCLPIDFADTTGSTFTLNPLLHQVADLELPAGEYAIFGSGRLLVRGVIKTISDTDILISSAEVIDGLPFVRLEYVVAYKRIANRRKDREHLQVLQAKGFWPETGQVAR